MNISTFADVDDHGLAGFWQLVERHGLSFTQLSPRAIGWLRFLFHEIGQLHPIEREVALLPVFAPRLNHEWEHIAILVGATRVRLALVPDSAADGVWHHGLNATVVQVRWPMIARCGVFSERTV